MYDKVYIHIGWFSQYEEQHVYYTIKGNYVDINWLIAKFLKQLRELTQECIAPDEKTFGIEIISLLNCSIYAPKSTPW